MLEIDTFLVRHGSYDKESGDLNRQGMLDAAHAAEDLQHDGLGMPALVLSSDTPRTMSTAQVIADHLSLGDVVPSLRMNEGGNYGAPVIDDLDRWIHLALEEAGVTLQDKNGLVVVTHEPLISAAQRAMTGDHRAHVGYGQVIQYTPGSWDGSRLIPSVAANAERRIKEGNKPPDPKPPITRDPGESLEDFLTRKHFAR